MRGNLAPITSFIIGAILALGAVLALTNLNPFWAGVAIWALVLVVIPSLFHPIIPRPSISWIVVLTTLPFLAAPLLQLAGRDPFLITSPSYWLLTSIALFALALVTMIYIDFYSRMTLNLNFLLLTTFLLYESLVIIQGPIDYYAGMWLGKDLLFGNTELMVYVIIATVIGLLLAMAFNHLVHRTELVEYMDTKVEGESS